MPEKSLANKSLVIIGGTTGLGLSAAKAFIESGAYVIVVAEMKKVRLRPKLFWAVRPKLLLVMRSSRQRPFRPLKSASAFLVVSTDSIMLPEVVEEKWVMALCTNLLSMAGTKPWN